MNFALNEENMPVFYCYNESGVLTSVATPVDIRENGRYSYDVLLTYPGIDTADRAGSLEQKEKQATVTIDLENFADGYVLIAMDHGGFSPYVYGGASADRLMQNLSDAKGIAEDLARERE